MNSEAATPNCQLTSVGGSCGASWNIPGEKVTLERWDISSGGFLEYEEVRGKSVRSLEPGFLYRVKSESQTSSPFWVPFLTPDIHSLPSEVPMYAPDGSISYGSVGGTISKFSFEEEPLENQLTQYNIYTMETVMLQMDQSDADYGEMEISFEGEIKTVRNYVEYNIVEMYNMRRKQRVAPLTQEPPALEDDPDYPMPAIWTRGKSNAGS